MLAKDSQEVIQLAYYQRMAEMHNSNRLFADAYTYVRARMHLQNAISEVKRN